MEKKNKTKQKEPEKNTERDKILTQSTLHMTINTFGIHVLLICTLLHFMHVYVIYFIHFKPIFYLELDENISKLEVYNNNFIDG